MLIQRPFEALTPTLDGAVLQVLAGAGSQFSVSRVTALVEDASPSGVRKALNRLVEQGTVLRTSDGVAHLYRLNPDHLLADPIRDIARARERLRQRVVEHADTWEDPPHLLAIFGSAARGEMHAGSDLDVLAVGDTPDDGWLDNLGSLCEAMTSWTGNDARPLVLSTQELTSGEERVLVEIGRDAWVLFGDAALLRHARSVAAHGDAA